MVGAICLIVAIMLLTLAFLNFPPITGGMFGALENIEGNMVVVAGPQRLGNPAITRIRVKVLAVLDYMFHGSCRKVF